MAVIKIVPMPGAEGQKGDAGATGAQGPQGPIGATGPAGADALWHYNGAWQSNASYAVGDLVTYQGQLYYTKATTTVGTLPTDTTKFDLIAAKGADAEGSSSEITPTSGSWGHDFFELSSLTTSTYDVLADYYKIGELVYFDLSVNLGHVSDWGTPIDNNGTILWPHWQFKLPFPVHSSGSMHNSSSTNLSFTGMIHDSSLAEDVAERTANDGGQNIVFGQLEQYGGNTYVYLHTVSQSQYAGYSPGELRAVTSVYPKDFTQPANIQTGLGASRLRISGTYRTAS
jgi:hypothetical protein